MNYLMTIINGEVETENKKVDQQFYDNYTSLKTRKFFKSLGGKETLKHLSDHSLLRSVSPDGLIKKSVLFYPC